jgi:hypothetical protein
VNNAPVAILGVATWVPSFSLFEPDVLAGRHLPYGNHR